MPPVRHRLSWRWRFAFGAWTVGCLTAFLVLKTGRADTVDAQQLLAVGWFAGWLVLMFVWVSLHARNHEP